MSTTEALPLARETSINHKIASLFLLLALIFGVMFIFLGPPFSGPDETVHYLNICSLSHGHFFPTVENGEIGSYIGTEELRYYEDFAGKYIGYGEKFSYVHLMVYTRAPMEATQVFVPSTAFEVNFFAYLIPAFIVGVLRLLGFSLNAYNTMLLAKLANLVLFTVITYFALKKTKLFPKTMFLLALMPMTLYQAASLSYDALLLPCCFLLFAYATKLLTSAEDYVVTKNDIVAVCLAAAGIAASKAPYLCLFAIFLTIPIKKFGSRKRYFTCIGLIAGIAIAIYLIPTLITAITTSGSTAAPDPVAIEQRQYFFSHLYEFPAILFRTFDAFFDFWLESFVGDFGWLDTPFPIVAIELYIGMLLLSAMIEATSIGDRIKWQTRVLSVASVIIVALGTFIIMFLNHNPVHAGKLEVSVIHGMQGRYFIPFALFIYIAFACPVLQKYKHHDKIQSISAKAIPAISLTYLCLSTLLLLVRFWI